MEDEFKQGDVKAYGSRQLLWPLHSSSPYVLCSSIHRKKTQTADHRKFKFIAKGVINLFSFYFSFSNILLISLIAIPGLFCDWARIMHAFQSTCQSHIFFRLGFHLFLEHITLCSAFASWVLSSCGSQFWDVLPAWPRWSGPQGRLCPTGVWNTQV